MCYSCALQLLHHNANLARFYKRQKSDFLQIFKVDSSLKHVGQNVGHQRYLEENYGKRVRVSSKDGREGKMRKVNDIFVSPGVCVQG